MTYTLDHQYDPDLCAAFDAGGDSQLVAAREHLCLCGHPRGAHMAATGALGSFGGTACDSCWNCPTFRPEDPALYGTLTVGWPSGEGG